MSLMSNPLATPSCVVAIFRYLARAGGPVEKHYLEKLLSPDALITAGASRDRVVENIKESVRAGLLAEKDGFVELNPSLPAEARDPTAGREMLPDTVSSLVYTTERDANRNLSRATAWFLAQNAYDPPGTWREVQAKLTDQMGQERFGLNDIQYGQFADWTCFLGFAWGHRRTGPQKKFLVPDPTAYLRRNLGRLIGPDEEAPIAVFMQRLKELCPVFEEGTLRTSVEKSFASREKGHLSTVTSFALLRLRDEGHLEVSMLQDADAFILHGAREEVRVSHVRTKS